MRIHRVNIRYVFPLDPSPLSTTPAISRSRPLPISKIDKKSRDATTIANVGYLHLQHNISALSNLNTQPIHKQLQINQSESSFSILLCLSGSMKLPRLRLLFVLFFLPKNLLPPVRLEYVLSFLPVTPPIHSMSVARKRAATAPHMKPKL